MRERLWAVFLAVAVWVALATPTRAQLDPRAVLGTMIAAFQNCGPPQVYQMLTPQLFQIIALQTGWSGCYLPLRAAGPVLNMQVLGQQIFPVGPLYLIRVQHQTGVALDWFIGFNQLINKIQFLGFQPASEQVTIATGPSLANGGGGGGGPSPPATSNSQPANCDLYAGMC